MSVTVALLSLIVLAAPLAVEGQTGTVARIGLLDNGSLAERAPLWEAFRQAMRELGYVEGRTVVFEARGADGKAERLPALAAELVRLRVDVIVTASNFAAEAAHRATATIPIVTASGDPLTLGLVTNLARPGGNVTGVTSQSLDLTAKRFELALELIPGASRIAILGTGSAFIRPSEPTARALGMRLHAVSVRSPAELDGAFSSIARGRSALLIVAPSSAFFGERRRLADLAVKHRLPTIHGQREYVEAGGLIAYGTKLAELFRRAAVYVDRF